MVPFRPTPPRKGGVAREKGRCPAPVTHTVSGLSTVVASSTFLHKQVGGITQESSARVNEEAPGWFSSSSSPYRALSWHPDFAYKVHFFRTYFEPDVNTALCLTDEECELRDVE